MLLLELAEIHEKFVVVPADKASNNTVFVCKTHNLNCLMEELGMSTMTGNPIYNLTAMSSDKILQNHCSVMLTRILTAVKEGLQKYCDIAYARSVVNQMLILKNSKELEENLKAQSLHSVNSIKSFGFSTLYTTIPHDKLNSKLKEIINQFSSIRMVTVAFSMSACCHWLQRHIQRSGSL